MRVTARRSSRDSHRSISASRASVSSMRELGVFRPASLRRAIIMPLFMLRSSPFRTTIVALGSIMPVAWGQEPPCPSQNPPGAAPGSGGVGALLAPAAPVSGAPRTRLAPDSKIDVTADSVDADVAGNGGEALLKGNVEVRQGDRVIQTNEAQLDRRNGSVDSDSHVDY